MNFEEQSELEEQAFLAFKKKYELMKPPPKRPAALSSKNIGLMFWLYMINALAALLLAAMRTTETLYSVAYASSSNPIFASIEAGLAVFAVEGGLVVLAASRAIQQIRKHGAQISGTARVVAILVMILISIFAGLTQSISSVTGISEELVMYLEYGLMIVLGVGVTIIAYIAGEIVGMQVIEVGTKHEAQLAEFRQEADDYQNSLLASWRSSPEKKSLKSNPSGISAKFAEPSKYHRDSPKTTKILSLLNQAWDQDGVVLSTSTLAKEADCAASTASEVRSKWLEGNTNARAFLAMESILGEGRTPEPDEVAFATGITVEKARTIIESRNGK